MDTQRLPLTMPEELWVGLEEPRRAIFRRAQAILDCLQIHDRVSFDYVCARMGLAERLLLPALRLLDAIGMIDAKEGEPIVLVALPDDHVRLTGPDGRVRWILVTRPIVPRNIPPEQLN